MTQEEELYERLMEMLVVGGKVRLFYGDENVHNKLCHIVAIVDEDYIVYKYWHKSQRWEYEVRWTLWFEIRLKDGILSSEQ